MSSSNKRRLLNLRSKLTSSVGNGCGCGSTNLSEVFQPKPKSETSFNYQKPSLHHASSSNSSRMGGGGEGGRHPLEEGDKDHTSTTFSLNNIDTSQPETDTNSSNMVSPCRKIWDSMAVVKDSDDPFLDFRRSMVEMILEKDLCSKAELGQLLNCFLELNSSCHHHVIVEAFMDVCNVGVSSAASSKPTSKKP